VLSFTMAKQLAPAVTRRILKELSSLSSQKCEGINVSFSEDNICEVLADIDGPTGTAYEAGTFRVRLTLGPDFPNAPPTGHFLTKVFHPNVSEGGQICVNVLKKDWKPDLGIQHVLLVIRCLLIQPFAESALNEEAGRLLLEDYAAFFKQAQLMTQVHAVPLKRPAPLGMRQGTVNTRPHAPALNESEAEDAASALNKKVKGPARPAPLASSAAAKKRALKRL
jgi:ubiquitin-conjugating enzyme E2 S